MPVDETNQIIQQMFSVSTYCIFCQIIYENMLWVITMQRITLSEFSYIGIIMHLTKEILIAFSPWWLVDVVSMDVMFRVMWTWRTETSASV